MGKLLTKPSTYELNDHNGNVTVNAAGVVLNKSAINGDVYLTPGIGEGKVTIQKSSIIGDVFVAGGGESITLTDTTVDGEMFIARKHGKVKLVLDGTTALSGVQATGNVHIVNQKTTPVQEVKVNKPDQAGSTIRIQGLVINLLSNQEISLT